MSVSKRRERLWQKKKNQWDMVKHSLHESLAADFVTDCIPEARTL